MNVRSPRLKASDRTLSAAWRVASPASRRRRHTTRRGALRTAHGREAPHRAPGHRTPRRAWRLWPAGRTERATLRLTATPRRSRGALRPPLEHARLGPRFPMRRVAPFVHRSSSQRHARLGRRLPMRRVAPYVHRSHATRHAPTRGPTWARGRRRAPAHSLVDPGPLAPRRRAARSVACPDRGRGAPPGSGKPVGSALSSTTGTGGGAAPSARHGAAATSDDEPRGVFRAGLGREAPRRTRAALFDEARGACRPPLGREAPPRAPAAGARSSVALRAHHADGERHAARRAARAERAGAPPGQPGATAGAASRS